MTDANNTPTKETPSNITLSDLIGLIESGIPFSLLDVREAHEWDTGHLEGAQLIPLGKLLNSPECLKDINRAAPVVVYCQHGIRSMNAARYLQDQGFDTFNLLVDWSQLDRS